MRRILVPLFGNKRDKIGLQAALALASSEKIHIDARLFQRDPDDIIMYVGEGASANMIGDIIQQSKQLAKDRLVKVTSTFEAWRKAGKIVDGPLSSGDTSSADLKEIVGHIPTSLVAPATVADVCIFARTVEDSDADLESLTEMALFESGRPVLLVPDEEVKTIGRRIVIGWNGSAEAARAVAVAMPLLCQAEAVFVIAVGDTDDIADPSELVTTLKINEIEAAALTVTPKDGVTEALLSEAHKVSADLLVIGAYSHNRLREFVMGGVTRDLRENPSIATLLVR